jgi:hypothetical protein
MRSSRTEAEDPTLESEDRMRELVALVERIELRLPGQQSVVAGFRRNGALSLYFGEDPVYQFDETARLRRAYVGGRLFRTQGDGLAALTRARSGTETALLRHDLVRAELAEFRTQMLMRVRALRDALAQGKFEVVDQSPPDAPVAERLLKALQAVSSAAGELAPAINRMR